MCKGNPDILICGNCKELFEDLADMIGHKKQHCKMKFTCTCDFKEALEDVEPVILLYKMEFKTYFHFQVAIKRK